MSLSILDNDEIILKRDNLACARPSDGHLRSWPLAISGEGVGTRVGVVLSLSDAKTEFGMYIVQPPIVIADRYLK